MLFWLSKTKRLEIYISMLYLFLVLTLTKILSPLKNKTLGRALDPRANGTWLSKLTEWNKK